ncbi:MAG: acyltransferase [Alphaproteobacteria bacterium]|nr:MAG: acyltransferase [Alphaproteobacteria bacterium]
MSGAIQAIHRTGGYRADIDGLRALAVVPVMLFHAHVPGFAGGFVGVDVFFVISGFLITSIIDAEIRAGGFSVIGFYERRVRRILPALFLICIFTAVAAWFLLMPADLRLYGRSLAGAVGMYSNFVFAAGAGYFDAPAAVKPLLHTWSLAIEEQFYLVFPWLLIGLRRHLPGRVGGVLAALLVLSLAASVLGVALDAENTFFMPHMRAWELLTGALLALGVVPQWRSRTARELAAVLGLVLILVPVFVYSDLTPFPGLAALPPCIGTALIIHAGLGGSSRAGRLLALEPLRVTGLMSYSLYLWHWPLIMFAGYIAMRPLTVIETAGILALTAAVSAASWAFVERPFRRRSGGIARRPLFMAAGSFAVVLIGAGAALDLMRGLPWRFPPDIARMVEAKALHRAATAGCNTVGRRIAALEPGEPAGPLACRFGAKDRPAEILLWGDSHAGALLPALDAAARRAGRAGLMMWHGGCPALLGVDLQSKRRSHRCRQFNDRVAEHIAATRPALVVIVSRWGLYANGTRYGDEEGSPMLLSPDGMAHNPEVFAAGLRASVAAALAAGARVLLVGPVPEVGFDAPSMVARARIFGHPPPQGPRREDFLARQRVPLKVIAELGKLPGVSVFWPHEILCGPEVCRLLEGDEILYFDDDHLSLAGSALFVDRLAAFMAALAPETEGRIVKDSESGVSE